VYSRILLLPLLFLSLHGSLGAQSADPPLVFDLPALQGRYAQTLAAATQLMGRGDYAQAEPLLRQAIEWVPHDPTGHYNLACAVARQGKKDEALNRLAKAVELGFRDAQQIKLDADLEPLRDEPRLAEIIKIAQQPFEGRAGGWRYQVTPARRQDGAVLVSAENTAWNSRFGIFQSLFALDRESTADQAIAQGRGKVGEQLRAWYEEGTAAGNHGDLYDNHDGDHSNMNYKSLPQLTRIEFSDEAKQRKLHMGAQLHFLYNGITIGNSSTALTSGPFWRSQTRYLITHSRGPGILYLQYVRNHLYFYPEHRDHDSHTEGKGKGDVFPANTPYVITSQGSSGSDRLFMNAVGATLAAFHPDVKQKLATSGTLMAAVQMIFRASNTMVETPADYLSGKAHPSVFDGDQLREERMVAMAHRMTTDSLPPMVQLKVVEEDGAVVGRDYFDVGPRQKLFDTPCAIARVVKSSRFWQRMVVSAAGSKDLNGRPLTYHWVLLRGDPALVEINQLDGDGTVAELKVGYHTQRPKAPGSNIKSNRVDVGLFVNNGDYYSAPGFVSFYYLDNEKRVYDDQRRIEVIDYTDPETRDNYVDPIIDFRKDWRDEYHYDEDGLLLGWTRIRGSMQQEFAADGRLILQRDSDGTPRRLVAVRYEAQREKAGEAAKLQQVVEAQ